MMTERSVVVTGAAQGIGLATILRLVARNWHVVAVDANEADLERLRTNEPRVMTVVGDIAVPDTLERAAETAGRLGPLAGWVNNAAIGANGRLDEVTLETIDRGIAVNLRAAIVGAQIAVRSFLRTATPGAIVNVSSVHGRVSYPGFAVYDACKGGLESFTRYVCVEYGHRGIRCNALAPGAVVTPAMMADTSDAGEARRQDLQQYSPMKALIPTAYYAELIDFLLSDAARYINGHVLAAEGGLLTRCYPFEADAGIPWEVS